MMSEIVFERTGVVLDRNELALVRAVALLVEGERSRADPEEDLQLFEDDENDPGGTLSAPPTTVSPPDECRQVTLTVAQMAENLQISNGQARALLARGLVPFFRTGPGPRAPIRIPLAGFEDAVRRNFGVGGVPSSTPSVPETLVRGSGGPRGPRRPRVGMRVASSRRRTQDGKDLDELLASVGLTLDDKE